MTAVTLAAPRVVIPPPAPDSPDADLIRLCTEYVALSLERDRILLTPADEPFSALIGRLTEMEPAIAALPALTDEGVRAKAAAVMHQVAADGDPARPRERTDAPAHSLAVDLLRPRAVLALDRSAPGGLSAIADTLDRLNAEIENVEFDRDGTFEGGDGAAVLAEWWATARTVLQLPAATSADVVALARICRATWARTPGDDCDLRDAFDQKLQQAVIAQTAHTVSASPDAELLALHDQFIALEGKRKALAQQPFTGDDDWDAAINPLNAQQDEVFKRARTLRATTLEGHRARARMMVVWDHTLLEMGGAEDGFWQYQLPWLLARDLLGADYATALADQGDAEGFLRAIRTGQATA